MATPDQPPSPDLNARLAALKAPGTPPSPERLAGGGLDPPEPLELNPAVEVDDPLASRFAQLAGQAPGSNITPNAEDSRSTADLIADVQQSQHVWEITPADEAAIDALLEEATLVQSDTPVPDWLNNTAAEEAGAEGEVEDEETVLRRLRDELSLEIERNHQGEKDKSAIESSAASEGTQGDGDDTEDIKALMERFQALGGGLELPAAPAGGLGVGLGGGGESESEAEGVHEMDTWCCICNEDAEFVCSGCEGDIYCSECLFEAHTGPDAGLEEKRHKWTKYIRPKKILQAA